MPRLDRGIQKQDDDILLDPVVEPRDDRLKTEESQMEALATDIINQHLIDPEICIHRNTCEATWPIDTVTHNDDNHVVDVEKYDSYMACIPPCPTGAIDNRRREARASAYGINEQFEWEELPEELNEEQLTQAGVNLEQEIVSPEPVILSQDPADTAGFNAAQFNASLPPWSAAHAYTNLYGPLAERKFISATMVGNFRVTEIDREYDTRHILPDFGTIPFPVLEGQSIGIIPSETDGSGKFEGGKLMLFFGERSKEELPYFGPLQNLPKDFIDINLAFARVPD
ncbi:MAG: hypothetical protein GY896_07485, partial [Gammaproteobacteria bacterium]|nr:hypothetical protein [Gammaproteobacteria bacterium]